MDTVINSTLLDALQRFDETTVVSMLEAGALRLTGNFRGREADVVASYKEAA